MEKSVKTEMEVIEFEAEDIITTSCSSDVRGSLYDEIGFSDEYCTNPE